MTRSRTQYKKLEGIDLASMKAATEAYKYLHDKDHYWYNCEKKKR